MTKNISCLHKVSRLHLWNIEVQKYTILFNIASNRAYSENSTKINSPIFRTFAKMMPCLVWTVNILVIRDTVQSIVLSCCVQHIQEISWKSVYSFPVMLLANTDPGNRKMISSRMYLVPYPTYPDHNHPVSPPPPPKKKKKNNLYQTGRT